MPAFFRFTGWKLGAVARGSTDSERLLDCYEYEEERAAFGKALINFTQRGLQLATTANPFSIKLPQRVAAPRIGHGRRPEAYSWLSPETAIGYRSSSIVHDHGGVGELVAGDRLPDVNLVGNSGSKDLFADWINDCHFAIVVEPTDAWQSLPHRLRMLMSSRCTPKAWMQKAGACRVNRPVIFMIIIHHSSFARTGTSASGSPERADHWPAYDRQDATCQTKRFRHSCTKFYVTANRHRELDRVAPEQ